MATYCENLSDKLEQYLEISTTRHEFLELMKSGSWCQGIPKTVLFAPCIRLMLPTAFWVRISYIGSASIWNVVDCRNASYLSPLVTCMNVTRSVSFRQLEPTSLCKPYRLRRTHHTSYPIRFINQQYHGTRANNLFQTNSMIIFGPTIR